MKSSTYLKWRNWLLIPATNGTGVLIMAAVLGVPMSWQLIVLLTFYSLWSDLIDAVCEGRPVSGPYRWKQKPPAAKE